MMAWNAEHKPAIEGTSRTEFQQLLTRLCTDESARACIKSDDVELLLTWCIALNAVAVQGLRVFFEDGARIDTAARAAHALALHAVDPGKFSFERCKACATPHACECLPRQQWLAHCRYRAALGDRIEVRHDG